MGSASQSSTAKDTTRLVGIHTIQRGAGLSKVSVQLRVPGFNKVVDIPKCSSPHPLNPSHIM